MNELYLRRVNEQYFMYALGRNGEPQTNGKISVDVKHQDHPSFVSQQLNLDKQGRVGLGSLKDIQQIKGNFNDCHETWSIE